ncbi:MAG: major capsid protein [Tissierellales bacterium]|jgi:hypothetical protein|nr:major capsid protein [Tissierellales bacterium]
MNKRKYLLNLQRFADASPKNIYEAVTAQELGVYYSEGISNKIPYLGQILFPRDKKLGLDLKWIKGSKGLPVVLKASNFDTNATLRDRIGFSELSDEMPFFKESMLIKEHDRQELNKVIDSGRSAYIDVIVKNIFDDQLTLVTGAEATEERMRMQLLSTGTINIESNGVKKHYDYKIKDSQKETITTDTLKWSDTEKSKPVQDIIRWMDTIEDETGSRPTRAICTRKTMNYLVDNISIRNDMNVSKGDKIIMTDEMTRNYFKKKVNLEIAVYNKKFKDDDGLTKNFFPDDVFTLIPDGSLGKTWFGTTPEESDLMSGTTDAKVSIVNKGVAITTSKKVDPVNVETKVTAIMLPSFEKADEIFIATVAGD